MPTKKLNTQSDPPLEKPGTEVTPETIVADLEIERRQEIAKSLIPTIKEIGELLEQITDPNSKEKLSKSLEQLIKNINDTSGGDEKITASLEEIIAICRSV